MSRIFGGLIITTILTCAFVWVRLQIVNISYDINKLNKAERILQEEVNSLTLRIDKAKSPSRLERLAKLKFKMHPPNPSQVIVLKQAKK